MTENKTWHRTALGLMLAGCFPLAAQADLVLYGRLYAELASETRGAGTSEQDVQTLDDAQGLGRIGLRFSQPLDNGWQAFGQYEWQMDAPSGAESFTQRDAFVGLRGGFGAVALGRFNGVYKRFGGTDFDPLVFTGLEARGHGGMSAGPFGTTGFVSRAIEYRAPVWQPAGELRLEAAAQYLFGEDDTIAPDGGKGGYLAGVNASWKALQLVAAVSHDEQSRADNVKLGLKVDDGNFSYLIQQETVETGGYDTVGIGEFLYGGVQYRSGKLLYVLQAGSYKSELTVGDAAYYAIGAQYSLADNVRIYGGYRNTDSDIDTLDSTALALGLRYDF